MAQGTLTIEPERFYGGLSPAEAPLYSYADATQMVGVPAATVAWWVHGDNRGYEPVLGSRSGTGRGLSFLDLLELNAIRQLRTVHKVKLDAIRQAIRYAEDKMGISRVLLRQELTTFGGNIFIEELGKLVGLSAGGQIALRDIIASYLRRVDRDDSRLPVRFYPVFAGMEHVEDLKPVAISPLLAFGRPTIAGTGIKTAVVAARIDAGETIEAVAEDYGLSPDLVTSAVRYEFAA